VLTSICRRAGTAYDLAISDVEIAIGKFVLFTLTAGAWTVRSGRSGIQQGVELVLF
jgi:hypothetical protein